MGGLRAPQVVGCPWQHLQPPSLLLGSGAGAGHLGGGLLYLLCSPLSSLAGHGSSRQGQGSFLLAYSGPTQARPVCVEWTG